MLRMTAVVGLVLALAAGGPSVAQDAAAAARLQDVRVQVGEAVEAIAAYSQARRAAAVSEARMAVRDLDAAIAALQRAARDDWAEMTQAARDKTDARLAALQTALIDMAERVGMLQAGADSAWAELTSGFVAAWKVLSEAIDAALDSTDRAD